MGARVLIIEDNPNNLELMTYLLGAFGHQTMVAKDGLTGIETARREIPDLILCDVQLPDIDGYEIANHLKNDSALKQIPLLAVTALAMAGDEDKAITLGFDGYISKPIDAERFVSQIEKYLDFAPTEKQLDATLTAAPESKVSPNRATIMVVDDQPVNIALKRSLLEPNGFTILAASGMSEALELMRHQVPKLILSDLGMLDGSGFDFIQVVKADSRLAKIPFILITSTHCDEGTRSRGLALGAFRVLFRPIEPDTLLKLIDCCIREGGDV